MHLKKNKGEWSELYCFMKIIHDRKLVLADKNLDRSSSGTTFKVKKVSTLNIPDDCILSDENIVIVKNKETGTETVIQSSNFINDKDISVMANRIVGGVRTFSIREFEIMQSRLGIRIIKGGNSNQKADILLDIENENITKFNEGFGVKSYLGCRPTLLNASRNTNIIYSVSGLDEKHFNKINAINTRTKLIDRIKSIYALGGQLKFSKFEADSMAYNLALVDQIIPELISKMILEFFVNRTSNVSQNLKLLFNNGELRELSIEDLLFFQVKIKRLLTSMLLGFFPGTKWDGEYVSNGTIVVKEDGGLVGFHIIELAALGEYLFENIKFDTPSLSRHGYGSLARDDNGTMHFKLNIQLRF